MIAKFQKLVELYTTFKANYPELADALMSVLTKLIFPVSDPVFSASGDDEHSAVAEFKAAAQEIIAE